jgi:chemotaxis protein MotA
MDISTGLGLLAGAIVVLTMIFMGGDLRMFISDHAVIIIFGGSFAATLIRFPLSSMFHGLPLGAKFAFTMRRMTQRELVDEIAGLAEIARKQGPIGLEKSRSRTLSWPRAFASSPTATMPSSSATISSATATTSSPISTKARRSIARVGDCAPAFGMIGTLIGMVQMFANMTDPSKLGPFMATALLATLYGAVLANIICLPIADKLHGKLVDEEINRTLIIDGVLMIRESKSPTLVREMLVAYLPEKHRSQEPEPVPA